MLQSDLPVSSERWQWLKQHPIIAPSLMCADMLNLKDDSGGWRPPVLMHSM